MTALTSLKTELAAFNQQQKTAFPATEVITLLHQRSDFYDALLCSLWHDLGLAEESGLSLIAVGGYGRREMFPLSDLDCLVLTENPISALLQAKLDRLFNLLWDAKLQLGCAIRQPAECLEIGRKEISVATNMLEGRFLIGNEKSWQALREQLFSSEFWTTADFFQAKIAEKNSRYERYHNTSYNLEPDLKHSPGGLRDLHVMQWIMLQHAGITRLEGLLEKGILFPTEYEELTHAQNVLFRMRFALHLQLKRYDNRLRFDRQLALSEQLGYTAQYGEGNAAVEAMMKTFFQTTLTISQITLLVLNQFEQEVITPQSKGKLPKNGEKQPLDPHFYLQDGTIFCSNPQQFTQQPETILDLFYHLSQYPSTTVSPLTLRKLRLALKKRQTPLSELPLARQRFIEIVQQPNMVKTAIVPMHRLGVLTAYLPQWQQIEGLMQFDLFHIYTVDEHSVQVMQMLEHFLEPEAEKNHPLCHSLLNNLPNRHLLYLAALFHDIGKGREGEHAEVGAQDMQHFAEQHGFNKTEIDHMVWLVKQHLTMSITAQRRDIHDPQVVLSFAETVGTPEKLAALHCLTVADICATNETLWNDWKNTLFTKLHQFTLEQLKLGDEQTFNYQRLAVTHRNAAEQLLKTVLEETEKPQIIHFWQQCPESYFVRNNSQQLMWHAQAWAKSPQHPLVLVSNHYSGGATEIFIHCQDRAQLFTQIAETLSRKKISIHDAQIITSENGLIFDSFIISEKNGQPLNENRAEHIQQTLHLLLQQPLKNLKVVKKPLKYDSFKRKTRLRFLANSAPNQTACELFTLDRDGLLAQIGQIFNQLGLNLINAKITTIGEQVEDFFVLCNSQNQALTEQEKQLLHERIIQELA